MSAIATANLYQHVESLLSMRRLGQITREDFAEFEHTELMPASSIVPFSQFRLGYVPPHVDETEIQLVLTAFACDILAQKRFGDRNKKPLDHLEEMRIEVHFVYLFLYAD